MSSTVPVPPVMSLLPPVRPVMYLVIPYVIGRYAERPSAEQDQCQRFILCVKALLHFLV